MQEQNYSFEELKAELLEKMKARGCTPITVTGYRYQCNSIFDWLRENGYSSYTKEGGLVFLQNYYNEHGSNPYYHNLRTVIYKWYMERCTFR